MRQIKFKLGGADWKIQWRASLDVSGPDGRTWGETHGTDRKILLSKKELLGKPSLAARVAFHELLHATLHMGGVTESVAYKTEEAVVCCIENIMWELIESGKLDELLTKVEDAVKEG